MRHGSWKVLARLNGGDLPRFENLTPERLEKVRMAELTDFEIYRVTTDPGETLNLAGRGLAEEQTLTDLLRAEHRSLAAESVGWQPVVP